MWSIEDCRKLLGDEAADMTDAQIEQLRGELCALADLVIEMYEDPDIRRAYEGEKQAEQGKRDTRGEKATPGAR